MKITPVILFSLFALVNSNPAPIAENAQLSDRQSFGPCTVSGQGGLDVRQQIQLTHSLRGLWTLLTQQTRALELAHTTRAAHA